MFLFPSLYVKNKKINETLTPSIVTNRKKNINKEIYNIENKATTVNESKQRTSERKNKRTNDN